MDFQIYQAVTHQPAINSTIAVLNVFLKKKIVEISGVFLYFLSNDNIICNKWNICIEFKPFTIMVTIIKFEKELVIPRFIIITQFFILFSIIIEPFSSGYSKRVAFVSSWKMKNKIQNISLTLTNKEFMVLNWKFSFDINCNRSDNTLSCS